jgi:ABC-type multidrug transport system fused ATPase/permease subunit
MLPTSRISVCEFSHLYYFLPIHRLSPPTGVGMFICTYIYMTVWAHTAEATAKRIRERYLKAILRQDIAFFDKVGAGEVTTRIQTDTRT